MDEDILRTKNVNPRNRRTAFVEGYKLRIGNQATLIEDRNSKAYGMVYSLTHHEIATLYAGTGLQGYAIKSILVELNDGSKVAAVCCNLLYAPASDESNEQYYEKLKKCMIKYNLPIPNDV